MKVIDLLNKIANGEEPPKEIKVYKPFSKKYETLNWDEENGDYTNGEKDEWWTDRNFVIPYYDLNEEIEVLDNE